MKHGYLTERDLEEILLSEMSNSNPDKLFEKYLERYSDIFAQSWCDISLKKGQIFYRGRKGGVSVPVLDMLENTTYINYPFYGKDIGSPPPVNTPESRFNRDGYSYLYLATDIETCVAETHLEVTQSCSIAKFECVSPGRYLRLVLDPCYYDEYVMMLYSILTQPIHAEIKFKYRLTQFFSDIIKKLGYSGIYFQSTQAEGKNVVCFYPENFRYIQYSEEMFTVEKIKYSLKKEELGFNQIKNGLDMNKMNQKQREYAEHIIDRLEYDRNKESQNGKT